MSYDIIPICTHRPSAIISIYQSTFLIKKYDLSLLCKYNGILKYGMVIGLSICPICILLYNDLTFRVNKGSIIILEIYIIHIQTC